MPDQQQEARQTVHFSEVFRNTTCRFGPLGLRVGLNGNNKGTIIAFF